MEVDSNGAPSKSKISRLTVASDKEHGILGKTDLDLSKFGQDEFNNITLSLSDCPYEGATLEVGLKGVEAAQPMSKGSPTAAGDLSASDSAIAGSFIAIM